MNNEGSGIQNLQLLGQGFEFIKVYPEFTAPLAGFWTVFEYITT